MAWRKKAKATEQTAGVEFQQVTPLAEPVLQFTQTEPAPRPAPAEALAQAEPAAPAQGDVVAVVREWEPKHDDSLTKIHAAVDGLGQSAGSVAMHQRPVRDYAEIEAAVDRITKRVKTRQVVVEETVTDYIEVPAQAPSEPASAGAERQASLAPPIDHKPKRRLAWFGPRSEKRRLDKQAKGQLAATPASDYQPQCAALTADGAQCRNSSRDGSKYCASHKGYQPPTTKGIAQRVEGAAWDPNDGVTDAATRRAADTSPRVRGARDTRVAARKTRKAATRRASPAPARKAARRARTGRRSR